MGTGGEEVKKHEWTEGPGAVDWCAKCELTRLRAGHPDNPHPTDHLYAVTLKTGERALVKEARAPECK